MERRIRTIDSRDASLTKRRVRRVRRFLADGPFAERRDAAARLEGLAIWRRGL